MKKGKWLLYAVCFCALFVIWTNGSGLYGSGRLPQELSGPRPDLIKINVMAVFGRLEKSPVEFLHDAHTQALAQKNLDCSACHPTDNGRLFPKFKRLSDTDRVTVMNLYHKECIGCHGELRLRREKTGPVECDDCHKEKSRFVSSNQPMGFDKSLHWRHVQAQENKCERCHHEYDEKTKTLFFAKDKESTCRYCHKAETKDNVKSMRLASHLACISCHRKYLAKNELAGPVECAGCHEAAAQRKIERIASVPRMPGKQPDVVLLKSAPLGPSDDLRGLNGMKAVAFDHKAH